MIKMTTGNIGEWKMLESKVPQTSPLPLFSATTQGLRVMGMDRTTSSTTSETLPTSRRRTQGRVADITATTS